MKDNIVFEKCGVDVKCYVGEKSYVLKKFNQNLKKELVTGLFFDQLIADWDIDFILDTIVKRDDNNFFIEKVAPKLFISYSTAINILTTRVKCQEHAKVMIEYMILENFYKKEANCLKLFPDNEIYSKHYVHSMNAYLRSVSIRIRNSKELLSLEELSSLFSGNRVSERSTEDKLKYSVDECQSILSRGLNKALNDEDIRQLIQKISNYILLNRLNYPDERTLKWIAKKGKFEETSEIYFKALLASEMIKKERERLKEASEINELIEEIKPFSYQDEINGFM